MQKSTFSKHRSETGFTINEAATKKAIVDASHGVGSPRSKWNPAEIVDDERGGYKVVITTKS